MFKKGNRVKILRKDIFHLKHRRNRNGTITRVDGGYIYVRPTYVKWEIELYATEIERIS